MTRKELIQVADRLTSQIEEANLEENFSPGLGVAVHKFEWLVHFEGHPQAPEAPPLDGGEAHARLMDSLSYILNGEVVHEGHTRLNGSSNFD